jgi:YD repeat-containing protein
MSDRRTFLGNAAAAAFLTQISPLRSFGFATEVQETINPTMSDREKAGLRGPVKTCVEETTAQPNGTKYSTTTEYSPDGRLLTTRITNTDGSEWVTTQTYDADGRLQKTSSGKMGEPANESPYAYDGKGRLLTITGHPEKGGRIDFQYDEQGRKTSIQSFDTETLKRAQSISYGGSLWDGAVRSGIGVPIGGKIITTYNENDQLTEGQLLDGQGRIVRRIVRTYDVNGRLVEEEPIEENPALIHLGTSGAEGQSQFSAAELEAINKATKIMMGGRNGTGTSYRYDAQGRVIEMRERNFVFDRVTTTSYNEHGDKSEEHQTMADNFCPAGVGFSMDENGTIVWDKPATEPTEFPDEFFGETTVRYSYEYDSYGNWTQQIGVCYRKLMYY